MLGINFIDPPPMTRLGNSMILTATNLFSKWTEAFAPADKRKTSVAASLVKLFCNKSIPMAVLSGNGFEFCNEVWLLQLYIYKYIYIYIYIYIHIYKVYIYKVYIYIKYIYIKLFSTLKCIILQMTQTFYTQVIL